MCDDCRDLPETVRGHYSRVFSWRRHDSNVRNAWFRGFGGMAGQIRGMWQSIGIQNQPRSQSI